MNDPAGEPYIPDHHQECLFSLLDGQVDEFIHSIVHKNYAKVWEIYSKLQRTITSAAANANAQDETASFPSVTARIPGNRTLTVEPKVPFTAERKYGILRCHVPIASGTDFFPKEFHAEAAAYYLDQVQGQIAYTLAALWLDMEKKGWPDTRLARYLKSEFTFTVTADSPGEKA